MKYWIDRDKNFSAYVDDLPILMICDICNVEFHVMYVCRDYLKRCPCCYDEYVKNEEDEMGDQWEYRLAISDGPLSASQLTNEFGKEGWEMVDVLVWPHGKADPETGAVPDRVWNYFKREKQPAVTGDRKAEIVGVSSVGNGSMETGIGTDQVGVNKDAPPRKPIPMTRNKQKINTTKYMKKRGKKK